MSKVRGRHHIGPARWRRWSTLVAATVERLGLRCGHQRILVCGIASTPVCVYTYLCIQQTVIILLTWYKFFSECSCSICRMKGTQFFVVSDTDFKLVQVRNSLKQSHQFNYCSVYLGPQRAKPINLAKPINFDRLLVNGCSMWVAQMYTHRWSWSEYRAT